MALRGHIPTGLERRPIQAPGLMTHGPFPGAALLGHHPADLPAVEILEHKVAVQAADMEKLGRENQRLAASHIMLRQEIVAAQKEMEMIRTHLSGIKSDADMQIGELLLRIRNMEADIHAGDSTRKELEQAHLRAQSLVAAREELSVDVQRLAEELKKASGETKNLPEMYAELDGLRQEHQKLRAAFEHEKGSNIKQVEQMRGMEKNLITMVREIEKLRAEVTNAEARLQATNPQGSAYENNPVPVAYQQAGQAIAYANPSYGQGGGSYANGGYAHTSGYLVPGFGLSGSSGYSGAYGVTQNPMSNVTTSDGANPYSGASAAGYALGGVALGEGNPYIVASNASAYDPARR